MNFATLSPAFAGLFPAGVVAAELRGAGDAASLLPEEALSVVRAVPKRVQEFAAGRACARRALAEFGITDYPLRVAPDRQPLWPPSLIGSITHTAGLCAAVVAERTRLRALGVDTEVVGDVKRELWPTICTAPELESLAALDPTSRMAAVTLMFSAKEAFYKCQYPLTGQWLNFHDLIVNFPELAERGEFVVTPTRRLAIFDAAPSLPSHMSLRGRYRFHQGYVSAGATLA